MRPESSGSSEKYSKFRPPCGLRLMFSPGPRRTWTPWAAASRPSAFPISSARSTSQLEPMPAAVGNAVAGSEPFSPRWSAEPSCLRSPCGPSAIQIRSMPRRGTARVSQLFSPLSSAAFSSRLSSRTSCALATFAFAPVIASSMSCLHNLGTPDAVPTHPHDHPDHATDNQQAQRDRAQEHPDLPGRPLVLEGGAGGHAVHSVRVRVRVEHVVHRSADVLLGVGAVGVLHLLRVLEGELEVRALRRPGLVDVHEVVEVEVGDHRAA